MKGAIAIIVALSVVTIMYLLLHDVETIPIVPQSGVTDVLDIF